MLKQPLSKLEKLKTNAIYATHTCSDKCFINNLVLNAKNHKSQGKYHRADSDVEDEEEQVKDNQLLKK